jgi:hypothetical protein
VIVPKIGQWLYASCSDADYGQIVAVGQDDNGVATIDILVSDPQDIISCEHNEKDSDGWIDPLTTLELPEGTRVILRHVQWRPGSGEDNFIVCNTPGDGCFRCTKLFQLRGAPAVGVR